MQIDENEGWAPLGAPEGAGGAASAGERGDPAEPPSGWWQASDGRWYPPDAAADGAWPAATPSTGRKSRPALVIALSLLLIAAVGYAVVSVSRFSKSADDSRATGRDVTRVLDEITDHPAGSQDGFTANFPIEPRRIETPTDVKGVHLNVISYETVTEHEDTAISVTNLPSAVPADRIQRTLDATIDSFVSKLGDTVVSRANTTYAGVAAEDAVLQKAGQVTHTRVFVVGARLFEAIDITASLDVARPNYDRVISSFALQ